MSTLRYDKPFCKIYFHEDVPCVHLEWKGFFTSEQFREACNASLQVIIDTKCSKLIADNSDAKVVSPQDQEWLGTDWMKRALENGYKYNAVIVAKDIFNKMAVKNIVQNLAGREAVIQFCEDAAAAKEWLKSIA